MNNCGESSWYKSLKLDKYHLDDKFIETHERTGEKIEFEDNVIHFNDQKPRLKIQYSFGHLILSINLDLRCI